MLETEVKIQRYERYKESGVEWLGEIPEHWQVQPGFTILSESKEKNIGFIEKTVLSLSYGNVIVKPQEKLTGLVPESFETYQLVQPGDLIIRPTDLQNDKTSLRTGLAKNKGIITSAYINLRVNKENDNAFYHYYLYTIDLNKVIYGLGSGLRQNISFWDFKRFPFPFPPLSEQTAIAQYLDDKTTKIDAAITIKEQQINLLKERKQILIHKAVTRGLDDSVALKDSGVEWIGEIPEHWLSISFRRISNLQQGLQIAIDKRLEEPSKDALEYITTKSIHNPNNPKHYVTKPKENVICDYQDVLLGRTGNTGEVVTNVRGVFHNNFFKIVYDRKIIERDFLVNYLDTQGIQKLIMLSAGVTTIPDLNHGDFLSLPFVLPPLSEQKEISAYIETASQKIETAISLKQQEIAKLKEYKSSLINGVVTGKVKVC